MRHPSLNNAIIELLGRDRPPVPEGTVPVIHAPMMQPGRLAVPKVDWLAEAEAAAQEAAERERQAAALEAQKELEPEPEPRPTKWWKPR